MSGVRKDPRQHSCVTKFVIGTLGIDTTRVSRRSGNGSFLTRDELIASYAIIRHNVRTYRSAGVVAVVKGKENAEAELKKFEASQASSDRHEGWRYFIEKTDLKAGTDPAEATTRRQTDLEVRESKALRDEHSPTTPSDPQR